MEKKYDTSQLLNFVEGSYLERTSRPVYALAFLLPFMAFYELGTILINTNLLRHYWQGRVVAFAWLQEFLEYIGFSSKLAWLAAPLTVVIILLGLQMASRKPWRIWIGDLGPMLIECVLLAVPLIVFSLLLNSRATPQAGTNPRETAAIEMRTRTVSICASPADQTVSTAEKDATSGEPASAVLADIVTGIGAGIYEELVFRLILICLLMLLFQDALRLNHKNAIILSVLVSAALFSAYHHIDFLSGQFYQRGPFSWTEFGFRTAAGVYFACLFAIRGFGITAGTHAFYDVMATGVNVMFFQSGN
jgi:membrane protease YdiL (CAAX protease family)